MSHERHHDPVQRVNEEHADNLLAVARAFGRHPDATSVRAQSVGPDGIDLVVATPRGQVAMHVDLVEGAAGGPGGLRKAFADLSRRARAALAVGTNEPSES